MLDWKTIVREKLGALPLDVGRREEIIEELAQQLEGAYQEEVARGVGEAEAARRSLEQFRDWEKLRTEVFESVKGTQLRIWEQNGTLAPRRRLVWASLGVALSFLLLPSFRRALPILPLLGQADAWDARSFSAEAVQKIERTGDKRKYARTLAYVALHSPDDPRAAWAAEKAIALDPELTWICAHVSHAYYLVPGYDPKPWIERLKGWDPDNAFVYLLEAGPSVHRDWETRWGKFYQVNGDLRRALAAEPRWRLPMEKAFAAPRMDSYTDRQFLLDREVLLGQGLDRPDRLLMASSSVQLPDLFMVKTYADHLRLDVGASEEKAGHVERALAAYQTIAAFGQKLGTASTTVEQMFSARLREEAFQAMLPLLRRLGRDAEAAGVQLEWAAVVKNDPKKYRPFSDSEQSPTFRSGRVATILGLILLLFAVVSATWLVCISFLRAKPDSSHSMNWMASRLGWAPVLLPVACLAFWISIFPYARPMGDYSGAAELSATYGSFLAGMGSLHFEYMLDIWIDHMFWALIWCAAVAIFGAVCLRWATWRRHAGQP